jgi:hypothetical protein
MGGLWELVVARAQILLSDVVRSEIRFPTTFEAKIRLPKAAPTFVPKIRLLATEVVARVGVPTTIPQAKILAGAVARPGDLLPLLS